MLEVLVHQNNIMAEQDRSLSVLEKSVKQINLLSGDIRTELVSQHGLIDSLTTDISQTSRTMDKQVKKMTRLKRQLRSSCRLQCTLGVCVCLLFTILFYLLFK